MFLQTLAQVGDDELSAPSGLPGWSRRHLVAHVHYNALALSRLASRLGVAAGPDVQPQRGQVLGQLRISLATEALHRLHRMFE